MTKKGFTLIELLIVIAILGALATVVTLTFPSALGKARDGQRRSDIKQYQVALEKYANSHNGNYPGLSTDSIVNLCTALGMTNCTQDPKSSSTCGLGTCNYLYFDSASTYVLAARLEKPVDATNKACFVVCSNGLSGDKTCPSIASPGCPLP